MEKAILFNDLDVVVSSRIRLARNICNIPFVSRMNSEQKMQVINTVKDALFNSNSVIAKDFSFIDMSKISNIEAASLVEAHLISPEFAGNREERGLLINSAKNVSIMINEEDHLRIQCIEKGQSLDELLEYALRLDDFFDIGLSYAFDEKLGFLTHCPTNLGTGLRASGMLFLPALTESNLIPKLINAISKLGLTVRGMYGEGSQANAYLYQVSNQITLGISETETVDKLKEIIAKLIEQERNARSKIYISNKTALEDRIFRAYGALTNARIISGAEFLKLLSEVRFGGALGVIKNQSLLDIDELFTNAQAANIMQREGKELSAIQRDIKRADIIRKAFKVRRNTNERE